MLSKSGSNEIIDGLFRKKGSIHESFNFKDTAKVKEIEDNKLFKEIKKMGAKCGYGVYKLAFVEDFGDGGATLNLQIIKDSSKKYVPGITIYNNYWNKGSKRDVFFTIATISYGDLPVEDYKDFLTACTNASEFVSWLNKQDFSKLAHVTGEYKD